MVRYGEGRADRAAFTVNVSTSGAYIRTNTVFRPGTTILVDLLLPGGTYSHWARVIWAKKVPAQLAHLVDCGMGVAWVNPGPDWKSVFERWSGVPAEARAE